MRLFCVFLALVALSYGYAQKTYFGVGGSYVVSSAYVSVPLLSLQVGGPTAPEFGSLEVRAAFDTILLFSNLGIDVLASGRPADAPKRVYFGGGPDILVFAPLDSVPGQERLPVSFGLHGTVGLEFLSGTAGPFAELQPAAAFLDGNLVSGLRARAGLNFYF
jgi:hypothetical protein